jgi:hypothetical protein
VLKRVGAMSRRSVDLNGSSATARDKIRDAMLQRMRGISMAGQGYARIALLTLLAATAVTSTACAEIVRDKFNSGAFDPAIWAPCPRVENTLAVVNDPSLGVNVAKLTVRPYPNMPMFGLALKQRNCLGENPSNEKAERAEIWEANGVRLQFGADVWYGFTMLIDGVVSPQESRLIIGQWKGPNDNSPMIAQRFTRRIFTITIEQPNHAPDRDPKDTQCRIIVAHDANLPPGGGGDLPHDLRLLSIADRTDGADLYVGSVGHDADEIVHQATSCMTDVTIEPHNLLPDAFGQWVRMVYHLKIAGDDNGLLEVWANGQPIVTVRGRIGFPGSTRKTQYFKFGPYRNQDKLPEIYSMLRDYARGPRRQDVE